MLTARAVREAGQDPDTSRLSLTGHEATFASDEIIVSKTDPRGVLTYVNDVFLRISGYTEAEMIGKPHNVIRHPHMPSCVFKLLWDAIKSGNEVFAYVMNRCKNGDHYWVLAHVTPTYDAQGQIIGYHSNRRVPSRAALAVIIPLYQKLREEEQKHSTPRNGVEAAGKILSAILEQKGVSYDKFVLSL